MSEPLSRERGFRIVFDGAVIVALVMQISAGLYWAGIIHQQMEDVTARVNVLERAQRDGATALTDVAVRLGRIEQKLTDIGQRVGLQ